MTPRGSGDLAATVRGFRQRAGLTQEELALRSGISIATVAGLENGRSRQPRIASLRLLADALDLTDDQRSSLLALARPGASPAEPETRNATEGSALISTHLPLALRTFSGRRDHLGRLDDLTDPRRSSRADVVTISGTAGVGKTAFAVYWAHSRATRFPDGQLYLDLRGFDHTGPPMPPDLALRHLLGALDPAVTQLPASFDAQVSRYRTLLADRRVVIVLDNVWDADQIRCLLPAGPACLVLVVSRNQLPGLVAVEGAQPMTLDVLSEPEARELLENRLGASRIAGEPGAVTEIITLCARLPLALALLAARAALYPEFALAALATELSDASRGLDAFDGGDDRTSIRAVFSWSYRTLSEESATVFRLLGAHCRGGFTAAAAASLAGLPVTVAQSRLGELTRAHLATEHAPGRYVIHDLLNAFAIELAGHLDREPVHRSAAHRLLDYYLHSAATANSLLEVCPTSVPLPPPLPTVTTEPLADATAAWAWLAAEHTALVTAVNLAADRGHHRHAWQLAWSLHRFLGWRGHAHDRVGTLQVGLAAAVRLDDALAQARIRGALSYALLRVGRPGDAMNHSRAALDLFIALDDRVGQAHTLNDLAFLLEQQGHHREALAYAQQAVDAQPADAAPTAMARSLNLAGWLNALLGNDDQAVAQCQQALNRLGPTGYEADRAATMDSIGFVHQRRGDHGRAAGYFQQAADLLSPTGDPHLAATILDHLGQARLAAGEPEAARAAWGLALPILERLQHPAVAQVQDGLDQLRRLNNAQT